MMFDLLQIFTMNSEYMALLPFTKGLMVLRSLGTKLG